MLENGLLLSTFAAMHLSNMNVPDLKIYDKYLIVLMQIDIQKPIPVLD